MTFRLAVAVLLGALVAPTLADGQRALDTELEFGPAQMKMLRSIAEKWSARL